MSKSPLWRELNKLVKEKEDLQKRIKSICDAKQTSINKRQLRRFSHDELYHSLVKSLGNVSDGIEAVKRKINRNVRFSNLIPETITIDQDNPILSPMPLSRTPPPSSSTPFLPLTIPQTVNTVSSATISSTPPVYSSPPITIHLSRSSFIPITSTHQNTTTILANEYIYTTPKASNTRAYNQNFRQEETQHNTMPNTTTPNNTMPNNTMPNNTMPENAMPNNNRPNNSMPNYTDYNRFAGNHNNMPSGSTQVPGDQFQHQSSNNNNRNTAQDQGTNVLLELTQSIMDQMRKLQQEMNRMNERMSDNETEMRRINSTLGAVNNSMNIERARSDLEKSRMMDSQNKGRRNQNDFESKYIWKKIERIPFFDGKNLHGLNSFISSCDSISKTLSDYGNPEHLCAFLSEIDQKITDHAYRSSYDTYEIEWETTKINLLNHYAYLQKSADVMTASVENIRQGKDEDLMKFADRARSLLHDLNLAYKPLTSQMKSENDKRVARCFVKGINNNEVKRLIPLGVISNLDDSIAQVLNLEAATGSNVSNRDLFCQTCRSVGHRESSCRLRNRDTNELLTSLLFSMTNGNRNQFMNRNPNYNNVNNNRQTQNSYTNYNNMTNNNRQQQNVNPSFNNNNQFPNRGNYNNNFQPQASSQQQNIPRNRPVGSNSNIRIVNANDETELTDETSDQEYTDNPFANFPDQIDQNNSYDEFNSGN